MHQAISAFTRDSAPCATPADIARQLRKARLIRVYTHYRMEVAYGRGRQVYRMPAVEAIVEARRHVAIVGMPQ